MNGRDLNVAPSLELSAAGLTQFSEFVTATLGIKMNASKLPMLQGRLQRRLRDLGLASLEAYRTFLFERDGGTAELQHFIDAVTTNKTDFFREPQHFDILVQKVLPELAPRGLDGRPGSWRCKVWSAPCSSGEEAYTLAMVLAEHASRMPGFDYAVLGTDISSRMLEHAERAVYDVDRIEPVPAALRARYLLRARDRSLARVRICPELRRKVSFGSLNFMDREYRVRDTFDVIFCRNVLIYFDKPTQEAVVGRLARHLRPGGFLFVGHSESLTGLDAPFEPCGLAVYRHLAGGA
ncbi:MAG: protein-glutamate O-methyltransferase [Planctomycetes bacterium]|nr:protein-glutamate O-methyltransferase [Planctomycetota bacterium]